LQTGRALKSWLAAAFVFTTIGADLAHTHGPAESDPTQCDAVCGEPSLHVSGHRSVDLSELHADCLACLHRGLAFDLPRATVARSLPVEAFHPDRSSPPTVTAHEGRRLSRAPPLA
jgi:hypothetical protein